MTETEDDWAYSKSEYCKPFAYVTASDNGSGKTTSNYSIKSCDMLRCLKCDLKVAIFENKSWNSDVDYIFLRTNYGMRKVLAEATSYSTNANSFACQCSKYTCEFGADKVEKLKGIEWKCGGHN